MQCSSKIMGGLGVGREKKGMYPGKPLMRRHLRCFCDDDDATLVKHTCTLQAHIKRLGLCTMRGHRECQSAIAMLGI